MQEDNKKNKKEEDYLGIDSLMRIFKESANSDELSAKDKETMMVMEELLDDLFIDAELNPMEAKANIGESIQKIFDTFDIQDENK